MDILNKDKVLNGVGKTVDAVNQAASNAEDKAVDYMKTKGIDQKATQAVDKVDQLVKKSNQKTEQVFQKVENKMDSVSSKIENKLSE